MALEKQARTNFALCIFSIWSDKLPVMGRTLGRALGTVQNAQENFNKVVHCRLMTLQRMHFT